MRLVEREIMQLIMDKGGQVRGLFNLSVELGITYSYAHLCIRRLEENGCIHIEKNRPTAPMNLYALCICKLLPCGCAGRACPIQNNSIQNSFIPRIRMTPGQRAELQTAAINAGQSITNYVRSKLFNSGGIGMEYISPALTVEDKANAVIIGNRLNRLPMGKRLTYLIALALENMRLLREVNDHRARQGLDLYPVYDPKDMKID
jgi:hypothetical protein